MNREIKIQFIIDNKHLSQSYTIDEIIEEGITEDVIIENMEYCDCSMNESNNHCEGDCIRFDNSKITGKRQFTGLKDKNNKEVYFGDILATSNSDIQHDVWDKKVYGFSVVEEYEYEWGISFSDWSFAMDDMDSVFNKMFIEVIGNIYENPELLN